MGVNKDPNGNIESKITGVIGNDGTDSTDIVLNATSNSVSEADLNTVVDIIADANTDEKSLTIEAEGTITIPAGGMETLSTAGIPLKIESNNGTLTIPADVISKLSSESKEQSLDIKIDNNVDKTKLSHEQQKVVGEDGIVFELTATIGDENVHELGGTVTYEVPRNLWEDIKGKDGIRVFWIDDDGNLEMMRTEYDESADRLLVYTDHFSYFMIGDETMVPDEPDLPPFIPIIPPTPEEPPFPGVIIVPSEPSGEDDLKKIAACAAAAVLAVMLIFLAVDSRRR